MQVADWWWIPITLAAALAQTVRNAAQRSLTKDLGTLGATLVRFLYGLPFALLWLYAVVAFTGKPLPAPGAAFLGWTLLGALGQIVATALLLRTMQERNFTLGVAYSKTEVLQIALFGFVILGDRVSPAGLCAIVAGTVGVLLMSPPDKERPFRALVSGWTSRSALLGLASGTGFAFAAIGYRGSTLAHPEAGFLLAAAFALAVAQAMQTLILGGWMAAREVASVVRVLKAWRRSLLAGFMGAAASVGWFTAFAIEPAAHVRTLAMVELLFAYAVSLKLFRERFSALELWGIAFIAAGVILITLLH